MSIEEILLPFMREASRQLKQASRQARRSNPTARPALDVLAQLTDAIAQEGKRQQRPQRAAQPTTHWQPGAPPQEPVPGLAAFLDRAASFISSHSGITAQAILTNKQSRREAYRIASKKLHPDTGGNEADMQTLTAYHRALTILDEL